ncbi:MFS transporter [Uliginosibacterium sp. H1]|uniref:MFS transporter n=1 Tax=Uliginosibacterium sp. H1 TaxID=3114757 RepID=UPI002E16C960|nr:MFS transporter [Uliginosibacterium sp. H1]
MTTDTMRPGTPPAPNIAAQPAFSNALVFLLACAAGLSVASLYYNQPILSMLAADFGVTPGEVGRVPTFTQIGYALGILLLAPVGDRFNRRHIILAKLGVLALALLAVAGTHALWQLCALSIVIGVSASLAQDCVPAAAAIAPEAQRGRIVGTVMTGLLLGILLSRVVSGVFSDWLGWRAMFVAAGIALAVFGVVAWRRLPDFPPTTTLSYPALIGSLLTLWRKHPALRRAALTQAFLSAAFSAFWSTLAVMLSQPPFGYGSSVAGLFGLAGALGALCAPLAGAMADRKGPELVIRLSAGLVIVSFGAFALAPHNLWILVLGTLLFDLGVQAGLIAHQSIIYGLDAGARSRLTALLITAMFIGMAVGSALGSVVLESAGWRGLSLLAAGFGVVALVLRLLPGRR